MHHGVPGGLRLHCTPPAHPPPHLPQRGAAGQQEPRPQASLQGKNTPPGLESARYGSNLG